MILLMLAIAKTNPVILDCIAVGNDKAMFVRYLYI